MRRVEIEIHAVHTVYDNLTPDDDDDDDEGGDEEIKKKKKISFNFLYFIFFSPFSLLQQLCDYYITTHVR